MDILIISLGTEESTAGTNTSGDATASPATADTTSTTKTPARAPNNFVLQNVAKFQRLLGPSLRADTPGIRQRLLRLIRRLAALYGPGKAPKEFQEAKFWDNFQVNAMCFFVVNSPVAVCASVCTHASSYDSVWKYKGHSDTTVISQWSLHFQTIVVCR